MKIQIYKDALKEFRWRMIAKGRVKADSGEGYKRLAILKRSLNAIIRCIQSNKFSIEEQDWNQHPAIRKAKRKKLCIKNHSIISRTRQSDPRGMNTNT